MAFTLQQSQKIVLNHGKSGTVAAENVRARNHFCLIYAFIYLPVFPVSTCAAVEFRCADGTCIPRSARCNQNIDCADASDEKSCSKIIH